MLYHWVRTWHLHKEEEIPLRLRVWCFVLKLVTYLEIVWKPYKNSIDEQDNIFHLSLDSTSVVWCSTHTCLLFANILSMVCWTSHSYCCHITRSGNFCMSAWLSSVCHWLLPLIGVSLSEPHTTRLYCACAYVYCAYVCTIACGHILNSKLYYVLQAISKCLQSCISTVCLLIEKTAWLANL